MDRLGKTEDISRMGADASDNRLTGESLIYPGRLGLQMGFDFILNTRRRSGIELPRHSGGTDIHPLLLQNMISATVPHRGQISSPTFTRAR